MKLDLVFSKFRRNGVSGYSEKLVFSVVDLDKANNFPENFVCIFPKTFGKGNKPATKFEEILGENSVQIAMDLLTKTLREVDDSEVKEELEKRIKALQRRTSSICVVCSQDFEPKKFGRYVQNVCQSCRSKELVI